MADPFDPGSSDPFGPEGPIPKPGQTVPPTNIPAEMAGAREQAVQLGGEVTGVSDIRQVLSGETPWTEAIAGALPMAMGGPEARAAERGVGAVMRGAEELYPKVGPPILRDAVTRKPITGKSQAQADQLVEAGKAFWGKQLTPEAEAVKKQRAAAQKDIEAGNYQPYFKLSERGDVNPTRYDPYYSTANIMPAKPETIKRYMAHASNPEGVKRLQDAYEKGLTLPNSGNWYFLSQLEREFMREYGEQGPAMFQRRVADALAATTGGSDPQSNLMTAQYGNYLAARGETMPSAAYEVPYPVGGGKYGVMPNLQQYEKMLMPGGTGVTAANPKRYNFSAALRGNPQAGVIDEQMSKLYDPKMTQPEHYGPYQQTLNDLAEANGVDPRYFQEVAWSGAKKMREPSYMPKPMIQEYNEAIERTSRITGVPPAEVVRRAIVRAEMPLYGAGGLIGAGQFAEEEESPTPMPGELIGRRDVLQIDPFEAAFHARGPGLPRVRVPKPPPKSASQMIDIGIDEQERNTNAALGAGAE